MMRSQMLQLLIEIAVPHRGALADNQVLSAVAIVSLKGVVGRPISLES
jgi:hypothetical protein